MIKQIVSLRDVENKAHYDVVFEWEDIFADVLHAKIRKLNDFTIFRKKLRCKLQKDPKLHQNINRDSAICFVMFPRELKYYMGMNVIPIFLDIWSDEDIDFVIKKTRRLKIFYVTSLPVFRSIKAKDADSCVRYMPLSVSDKYYSYKFEKYKDKKIDVIQMGRNNRVLHEYMLKYVAGHPEVEYVYTSDTNHNSNLEYTSTKNTVLGVFKERKDFVNMLSSAKVSLVSTPAIDNSRKNANGIDFPTPRFYESAIFGCAMLGRYVMNEEIKQLGLDQICPNIVSYEQFETLLEEVLSKERHILFKENREFILNNLTSCRAYEVKKDLEYLIDKSR